MTPALRGSRRRLSGRVAVDLSYGRNCVAGLPSGHPAEILPTPWGTEALVLRDPDPAGIARLAAAGGLGSVRFWLSPCGDHALAWGAADIAHFQLFCALLDDGWHQGRIDVHGVADPIVTVQDPVAAIALAGRACRRMAGRAYRIETGLRTIPSEPAPDSAHAFG